MRRLTVLLPVVLLCCARPTTPYDVLIRGATVYDGTGAPPVVADVAIDGERIAAVGSLPAARGRTEIDARGLAVAPGFINMLSHSEESLLRDGRGLGVVAQGVTLEVLGESSMAPLDDEMKARWKAEQDTFPVDYTWTTLGGYFDTLERRGIAVNVASFIGAGTVRERVLGMAARPPTPAELDQMRALVAQGMDEGAIGLTTMLIYPPDTYATTEELVALAKVAAARGGSFSAHIRNEGGHIDEALDEVLRIAREAGIPVAIYHFKLAGRGNWGKLEHVLGRIEAARAAGLRVTANMYTYTAGATGLDAAMPRWVQEGGYDDWARRLADPAIRARVREEMEAADTSWDNWYQHAGPENMRLIGFKNPALRRYLGRTLAEVAAERRKPAPETAMDLVIEDGTRVEVAYFVMSDDNLRRELAVPWMSIGSDAGAMAPEPPFTDNSTHPRAYGNFARLLATYVRDQKVLTLEEAIRRLTSLPATTLGLSGRGTLAAGGCADVVVFDPARVQDLATYEQPHRLAAGVIHVLVNGVPVLVGGQMTAARPGRIVRGPGFRAPAPAR
jgi:N-acyl-D-amino-acid deacylase